MDSCAPATPGMKPPRRPPQKRRDNALRDTRPNKPSNKQAAIDGSGTALKGELPKAWHLSDDPNRMVPLLLPQTQWLIVVAGDPLRNRSCIYRQNFKQGYATSKQVQLPAH